MGARGKEDTSQSPYNVHTKCPAFHKGSPGVTRKGKAKKKRKKEKEKKPGKSPLIGVIISNRDFKMAVINLINMQKQR